MPYYLTPWINFYDVRENVGLPATCASHVYSTHVWQKVYVDHDCVALLWIPFMAALPSSFTCYAYKS